MKYWKKFMEIHIMSLAIDDTANAAKTN